MEMRAGEVIHMAPSQVKVVVRFWDEEKPEPQDLAEITVFLNTEETNVFILKTQALMKAQELITHIAGVALGRGDQLLNDLILMYESLRGDVSGLASPVTFPPAPAPYELPPHLLSWREGDEITEEHRNAVADSLSHAFKLSPAKAAMERDKSAQLPESAVATHLAVIIATLEGWDADTFKRTFPQATNSDSLAVRMFLDHAEREKDE